MLVSACGGSSSSAGSEKSNSTSASKESTSAKDSSSSSEAAEKGKESKAAGASKYTGFGGEAPAEEREAASKALEQSLDARAAHDFKAQCATLSVKVAKGLAGRASFYKVANTCAAVLAEEAKGAPASVLANNLEGEIVALRVKGGRGYAIYNGTDGKSYAMPMALEDGTWKVAEVVATEVPEGSGGSSK